MCRQPRDRCGEAGAAGRGRLPAAGEVLVEIHAASINAADWKMRGGAYGAKIDFPHVPGRDFSGVVLKSAGDFKPGDAVFGVCEVPREGAYAQKIAIREAIVARKPEKLSHVQCAAVALTGLTALISLEDTLKLKRGEIAPGKAARGDLIFYVYSDAKDLTLAWTSADGTTRLFKLTR